MASLGRRQAVAVLLVAAGTAAWQIDDVDSFLQLPGTGSASAQSIRQLKAQQEDLEDSREELIQEEASWKQLHAERMAQDAEVDSIRQDVTKKVRMLMSISSESAHQAATSFVKQKRLEMRGEMEDLAALRSQTESDMLAHRQQFREANKEQSSIIRNVEKTLEDMDDAHIFTERLSGLLEEFSTEQETMQKPFLSVNALETATAEQRVTNLLQKAAKMELDIKPKNQQKAEDGMVLAIEQYNKNSAELKDQLALNQKNLAEVEAKAEALRSSFGFESDENLKVPSPEALLEFVDSETTKIKSSLHDKDEEISQLRREIEEKSDEKKQSALLQTGDDAAEAEEAHEETHVDTERAESNVAMALGRALRETEEASEEAAMRRKQAEQLKSESERMERKLRKAKREQLVVEEVVKKVSEDAAMREELDKVDASAKVGKSQKKAVQKELRFYQDVAHGLKAQDSEETDKINQKIISLESEDKEVRELLDTVVAERDESIAKMADTSAAMQKKCSEVSAQLESLHDASKDLQKGFTALTEKIADIEQGDLVLQKQGLRLDVPVRSDSDAEADELKRVKADVQSTSANIGRLSEEIKSMNSKMEAQLIEKSRDLDAAKATFESLSTEANEAVEKLGHSTVVFNQLEQQRDEYIDEVLKEEMSEELKASVPVWKDLRDQAEQRDVVLYKLKKITETKM